MNHLLIKAFGVGRSGIGGGRAVFGEGGEGDGRRGKCGERSVW